MSLTTSGQIFSAVAIASLGCAYWLGRGVSQRTKPGGGTSIFLVVVLFFLIALAVPLSYFVGQAVFDLATKPRYSASVVGHTSRLEDYEYKDSNDRTVRSKRWMHVATVRFTGPQGEPVELPSSISSTAIPKLESPMTVVYMPGDSVASELSVRSVGLLLGGAVMLFILGYFLWVAVWYAMGKPMQGVSDFGGALFFKFLLPCVTLLMMAAMAYAAMKYFFLGNPDEFPLWVAIMCTFFTLCLLPLVIQLFKGKTKNKKRTKAVV
jgi:hypothetical protein